MDPTATLHVHETVRGQGKVYHGEQLLAEVEYSLKDVEEAPEVAAAGGDPSGAVAVQRNIYGIVKSPGVGVLGGYVGARLALHLGDGRRLDFTVAKVLRVDAFLIQGLGGFR